MRILVIFLLLLTLHSVIQEEPADKASSISQAVEEYLSKKGFSGTILVARKGETVYHRSFGLAYRATPDTIQNHYRYSIASVTKLFTSIRTLQLAEEEHIDLGTSVITYLPELGSYLSPEITIHHLLLHISGLRDESRSLYRHPYSLFEMITKTLEEGKFGAINTFNYNNLDYLILGYLIERVSGNTWAQEISDHILIPFTLKETGFLKYGDYPDDFAYTYAKKWYGFKQDPLFYIENFYSAGSMYSTASDLLKLDQALYGSELLNEESLKLLSKSYPEYNYAGYGVWNYSYPFVESQPVVMERRGGILGANAVLVRLTDNNDTIIILSNDDRFNPDSFGDEDNLREMLIRALY